MARKYGAPYIGSKNNIAEEVVNFLPAGKRLCDLFGGGGAISHCALTYGRNKYGSVLYNDVNPIVVEYVKGAFSGKYNMDVNEPEIITRDRFHELKTKRGDIAFLWSFGNNGLDYLWSKDREEFKLAAFAMLTRGTVGERYYYYKKLMGVIRKHASDDSSWIYRTLKDDCGGSSVEAIELIQYSERIQSIERDASDRIQFSNIDYSEYEYVDGDVVYCDIPYENSGGKTPYKNFDFEKFYEWAYSRPFPVYISSYGISDDRFDGIPISKRRQLLTKTTDDNRMEKIFMNNAARKEKSCEMLMF